MLSQIKLNQGDGFCFVHDHIKIFTAVAPVPTAVSDWQVPGWGFCRYGKANQEISGPDI